MPLTGSLYYIYYYYAPVEPPYPSHHWLHYYSFYYLLSTFKILTIYIYIGFKPNKHIEEQFEPITTTNPLLGLAEQGAQIYLRQF